MGVVCSITALEECANVTAKWASQGLRDNLNNKWIVLCSNTSCMTKLISNASSSNFHEVIMNAADCAHKLWWTFPRGLITEPSVFTEHHKIHQFPATETGNCRTCLLRNGATLQADTQQCKTSFHWKGDHHVLCADGKFCFSCLFLLRPQESYFQMHKWETQSELVRLISSNEFFFAALTLEKHHISTPGVQNMTLGHFR